MTATDASAALAAIRAREQAATPGPWMRMSDGCGCVVTDDWTIAQHGDNPHWQQTERDGEFIAHARDDVRRMVKALDAVLALCDEWEAGPWSWLKDTAAPRIRAAITDALREDA